MTNQLVSKKSIFKKYDIRGIYPGEIDETLVTAVTDSLAQKVFKRGPVVLGHDARNSSLSLYKAAYDTLEKTGMKIIDVGMMTTPMLAFLVNDFKASGGIMITASHNPKEYNGIKAAGEDGGPISGEEMYELL